MRHVILRSAAAALATALAAAALLLAPAPARACTCAATTIQVLPAAGVAAPTNTHVWVLFPDYDEWLASVGAKDADVGVAIRVRGAGEAPAKKGKKASAPAPKVVAADRVDLASGKWRVLELAPKSELKAKAHYQVVMWVAGGKQEVVGDFTTSDGPDTVAPTFAGVKKAQMQRDGTSTMCGAGVPLARLVLGDVADEGGAGKEALVYGLWAAGSDGKVAYDQPPAMLLLAHDGKLVVGKSSLCATENYVFPKDAKQLILGIRVMDLAGNKADTAGEVVLDLSKVVDDPTD